MTEAAIEKIGEYKASEFGTSAIPEAIDTFLRMFRHDMDLKIAAYREELQEIERNL